MIDSGALRERVIATARAMNACGINRSTAGNVSARTASGFLITPSAMPYASLTPDDIVDVKQSGEASGIRVPSTEWRFHRDIYASRAEVGAIVHAHSPFATTLACLDRGIPPFHYAIARAGGKDIRCAPYATFGSQALSDNALRALSDRRACLLAHHGMIAVSRDLDTALALAIEVETLAEMYWRALLIGEPAVLSDDEMQRVLKQYESYGTTPSSPQ